MLTADFTTSYNYTANGVILIIKGMRFIDDPNGDQMRVAYFYDIHHNAAAKSVGAPPLVRNEERVFTYDQTLPVSVTRQAYDDLKLKTELANIVEGGWLAA